MQNNFFVRTLLLLFVLYFVVCINLRHLLGIIVVLWHTRLYRHLLIVVIVVPVIPVVIIVIGWDGTRTLLYVCIFYEANHFQFFVHSSLRLESYH